MSSLLANTRFMLAGSTLLAACVLTACGGGGSSGNPRQQESQPDPEPSPLTLEYQQTRQFVFSWDPIEDAAGYKLLENPDGQSGFSDVTGLLTEADLTVDPDSGRLTFVLAEQRFLPDEVNTRYMLQVCDDDSHCSDTPSLPVTGTMAGAVGYLKSDAPATGVSLGFSMALSDDGQTLAAATHPDFQQVYVFTQDKDGLWQQQAILEADNREADDRFGITLALAADGNTLAVGAHLEDGGATVINGADNNDAESAGAVYVYARDGAGAWSQQAYIKASNAEANDFFGRSLALSADGNTLAAGAPAEDSGTAEDPNDNSVNGSGAVYLFARDNGAWTQTDYLKSSDAGSKTGFGSGISLNANGTIMAIGASYRNHYQGAVYIYRFAPYLVAGEWQQQDIITTPSGQSVGRKLQLSATGDTLAIGVPYEDSAATGINGNSANTQAHSSGATYVFVQDDDGLWQKQAYIKASNAEESDIFGSSISLSADGSSLAVGAQWEDSSAVGINDALQGDNSASFSGAAYLFTRQGTRWRQQAYIKASNTGEGDGFGRNVALDGDASQLLIGGHGEDSSANGMNGDQSDNNTSSSGAIYWY